MQTFWNEIDEIERYLQQIDSGENRRNFQARLLIDPQLQEKVRQQQLAYELIERYGRRKLKKEILRIEAQLFQEPGFIDSIISLFK